jgi:hypothetical protein
MGYQNINKIAWLVGKEMSQHFKRVRIINVCTIDNLVYVPNHNVREASILCLKTADGFIVVKRKRKRVRIINVCTIDNLVYVPNHNVREASLLCLSKNS